MKNFIKLFFVFILVLSISLLAFACQIRDTNDNNKPADETINLDVTVLNLKVGETYQFNIQNVGFKSDDEAICKFDGSTLTALAEGSAKVTVYLLSNESVTKTVIVTVTKDEVLVPSIEVDSKIELFVGEEKELPVVLKNSTALITITSTDEEVVTVSGNKLTGVSVGLATVKVEVEGLGELAVNVQVTVKGVPALDILGDLFTTIGSETTLTADVKYASGDVEWSSSDETIATVNGGVVRGLKVGTVTITAKLGELVKSVDFTVNNIPIVIEGEQKVYSGDTIQFSANLNGAPITGGEWASADGTVAEVDADGKVTGVRVGNVTISVTKDDYYGEIIIEVAEKPTIEIKGRSVVYIGKTTLLEAVVTGTDAQVEWSSGNDKVATVDGGLVTGLTAGVIFVTAKVESINVKYKITCMEEPDQVVLEYDGGVSTELYREAVTPVTTLKVDNFNYNQGAFWAQENYRTYVFMGNKSADPGATFSDRIYIGRDELDGYYKVISILLSGGSSWPAGAEFVITVSSSYKDYRSVDAQCKLISVGDIVICDKDYNKDITLSNPALVSFYSPKTDAHEIMIPKETFTVLPTPTRLGYEFVGWEDTEGQIVTNVVASEIHGSYELKAKWNELNPVTMIVVTNLPKELIKGTTIDLDIMLIPDDCYFKTVFYATSNSDVIQVDENGHLVAKNAGEATVTITDFVGRVSKSVKVTVYPQKTLKVTFDKEFDGILAVDENTTVTALLMGKPNGDVTYTFESSNGAVFTVDENGRLTGIANGDADLIVKATMNGETEELSYKIHVGDLASETKVDELLKLIAEGNYATAQYGNACKYDDGKNKYYEATYGSLNKYLFEEFVVNESYKETARGNSGGHKDRTAWHGGVEFVTVHDTATLTGTVVNIASYMATGGTSIHYTTGNGAIYAVVPEEYIAYHAGDGTGVQFQWYDTGVMLDHEVDEFDYDTYPKFTIEGSGSTYYFYVDGKKTNIQAPISNGSKTIANPGNNNLPDLGPVWKVVNGKVYMGPTWVDFSQYAAGTIGSHGGNNNSIGIEMCVNYSTNQWDTYMRTAKLVADICIRNNLDLTRVKQHNTWTGKNCPQCLRAGGNWWDFMDLVATEYKIMKLMRANPDLKVEFECESNIVNKSGVIVNAPAKTTVVTYKVTVSDGKTSKTIELSSVVAGTSTWDQWEGMYKSSILWNGGKFF